MSLPLFCLRLRIFLTIANTRKTILLNMLLTQRNEEEDDCVAHHHPDVHVRFEARPVFLLLPEKQNHDQHKVDELVQHFLKLIFYKVHRTNCEVSHHVSQLDACKYQRCQEQVQFWEKENYFLDCVGTYLWL